MEGAAWLFQPLVLNIAEEAWPEEGVGLLAVGQIRRHEQSLELKSTILIDGSGFSGRADDEEFVGVADDLKTVGWVCFVGPLAKELRPGGSASAKEHDAEERDRDEAQEH